MRLRRIWFYPSWKLTNYGFLFNNSPWSALRVLEGCDEYHNRTKFVIVPLIGEFGVYKKGFNLNQPPHLYAHGPDGWEGADVPGCEICAEFKADLAERRDSDEI